MAVYILILGVIFGSFINALVWRLHLKPTLKTKKSELSILKGHSICPHCRHRLSSFDLIPILSWLMLRGRCRYCQKNISIEYPVVELLTGLLFLISYVNWPLNFSLYSYVLLAIWLAILVLFISLSLYDLKYKILPNTLVYLTISLSLIYSIIYYLHYSQTIHYVVTRIIGVILSAGVFYFIFHISNGKWIGGGDVKLCISLGLLLGGPLETILMIFIASSTGSIVSLILIALKKLKPNSTIAFGPLLIFGTFVCFLFQPQLTNLYTRLLN
ncbi:MAG TPA: prepilin peptidase [Candidatus Saccharimonadales bacterium]|jgi:leader peptidase (prepilin peptidase)/N-methyltransferase|nr:prepilin peptidase [Candidatus Saccharimonadales bacterium]